ncbi:MAG: hypothetical protein GY773_15690, partial [Actinomycetia bacterium]|nr:hypothetical protein [Actinomycetes bacterium]
MDDATEYPFLTGLMAGGVIPVGDWTFKHHTKGYIPRFTTVSNSAGYSASTDPVTATVANARVFRVNDQVINFTTKEIMRVTSIESTTSIKLARTLGSVAKAAGSEDDLLIRLSQAARHGEAVSELATEQTAAINNYIQHNKKAVRINLETEGVQLVGGDPKANERAEKLVEMYQEFDNQIIFGEGAGHVTGMGAGTDGSALGQDASAHHPLYMSRGIRTVASSYTWNNFASNGVTRQNLTEAQLNTLSLDYIHVRARGQTVPLFCSSNWIKAFGAWGRNKLQYGPSDTVQGIYCNRYRADGGWIEIIDEPQLVDFATNAGWGGAAFSVVPGKAHLAGIPKHFLNLHEDIV